MKKKAVSFLAAIVLLGAFTSQAYAYNGYVTTASGQTIYYNYNSSSQTIEITCPEDYYWGTYTKPIGALVIPDSINHCGIRCPVTSIGESAFRECTDLTSVAIPNSVTLIDGGAFEDCLGLASVIIPNSITSIGGYAFYHCSSLSSITIPNSVTSIGNCVFEGCSGLTSITIPNSVTSIGNSVFHGCRGLTSITIPNSVTSIGDLAFCYCDQLTTISIPNSVTSIGEKAFKNCTSLTSVTIGSGVTTIGSWAFELCNQIEDIHMRGSTPPTVQYTLGVVLTTSTNLYVPCDAIITYSSTYPWNQCNITDFAYCFSATSADLTRGTVQVIHAPECTNWEAEVQATPYHGFHFVRWSDGDTHIHRYMVVVQDTAIQAEFAEGNVGIADVEADGIHINSIDGRIVVEGATDEVYVYDMMGRTIRNEALPTGVYLVKVGTLPAKKVVVVK